MLEEDFSDEAINYALSNAGIDWKQNALEKAKDYAKNDHLSRSKTEFNLQNLDGFEPEEEVKYAVENSGINWKEVALERAKEHKQGLSDSYTASELREILKSSDKFGDEEIQYALDNLQ